jgi:hypothetical protein
LGHALALTLLEKLAPNDRPHASSGPEGIAKAWGGADARGGTRETAAQHAPYQEAVMARGRRRFPAPGRNGPVDVMPWSGDAFPSDWRKEKRGKGKRGRKTPRPGARTGPVR